MAYMLEGFIHYSIRAKRPLRAADLRGATVVISEHIKIEKESVFEYVCVMHIRIIVTHLFSKRCIKVKCYCFNNMTYISLNYQHIG